MLQYSYVNFGGHRFVILLNINLEVVRVKYNHLYILSSYGLPVWGNWIFYMTISILHFSITVCTVVYVFWEKLIYLFYCVHGDCVLLICISLMTNDIKHLFMWLLETGRLSLEKCRYRLLCLHNVFAFCLIVLLICISLMTNNIKHLSMWLLATGILSLKKYIERLFYLYNVFAYFWLGNLSFHLDL